MRSATMPIKREKALDNVYVPRSAPIEKKYLKPYQKGKFRQNAPYTPEYGVWVCEMVACNTVGPQRLELFIPGFPTHYALAIWSVHHAEFYALYMQARAVRADALVEEGVEILDNVDTSRGRDAMPEVMLAKERAAYRRWMAGQLNRGMWGSGPNATSNDAKIQASLAQLAVRARKLRRTIDVNKTPLADGEEEVKQIPRELTKRTKDGHPGKFQQVPPSFEKFHHQTPQRVLKAAAKKVKKSG